MKKALQVLAVIMMMVELAQGQGPATSPAPLTPNWDWQIVAKYVDDQTALVAHLDSGKVDLAAAEKLIHEIMDTAKVPADDETRQALPAMWTLAAGYQKRFTALGGRQIYLLISHPDVWPGMKPIAVLLPLKKGADPKGMMDFLQAMFGDQVVVRKVGDDLVYVGQSHPLQRFATMKPQRRSDIEQAMASSAGGALQLVIAPTKDERRAIAELLPRLPIEMAADPLTASTEFLTRGLKAATLRVDLAPHPELLLTFEMDSQADADKAATLLAQSLDLLADSKDFKAAAEPELRELVKNLRPQTLTHKGENAGASVTLTLDEKKIRAVVGMLCAGAQRSRLLTQRTMSASNIRETLVACTIYAASHNNEWPATLDELVKAHLIVEKTLLNPADPKHRRYVYHPWTKDQMKKFDPDNSSVPVIWEAADDDAAGLNIGYLDCHVDFVATRKQLDAKLKQAAAK